jgi:hypothetical protein
MAEQTPKPETQPEEHVIREDNWFEYQTRGFSPVRRCTRKEAETFFGADNVYPGDAWDSEADRPLRHKPGTTYYTNYDGLDYSFARWQEDRERVESEWRQASSGHDPDAS